MHKTTLLALALALACGTAAAQPAPPAPPAKSLMFSLTMKHGNDARTYNMLLGLDDCGEVSSVEKDRIDEIEVCAEKAANGVRLRTKWRLREGRTRFETTWGAVVARGATVDVGQYGGVRLTLAMK